MNELAPDVRDVQLGGEQNCSLTGICADALHELRYPILMDLAANGRSPPARRFPDLTDGNAFLTGIA